MIHTHKKSIFVAGLGVLLAISIHVFPPDHSEYIFDNTTGPSIARMEDSEKRIEAINSFEQKAVLSDMPESRDTRLSDNTPPRDQSAIKDLFSRVIVNSGITLGYFTWLDHEFRHAGSRDEQLDMVREKIYSRFPPEEARQLYETYRRYLDCETGVAELARDFGPVYSAEEGLKLLRQVQDFRRETMGVDLADSLYGEQVKEAEYTIRKTAIIGDKTLYASEKQEQLERLNADMWGQPATTQAIFQKDDPYARYQDALAMNRKDMREMASESDRQTCVDNIRNQFFAPEVVDRMKAVEQARAGELRAEQAYDEKKQRVVAAGLPEDRQAGEIDHLRQEVFGDQAEAMKRREAIQNAKSALVRRSGAASDSRL